MTVGRVLAFAVLFAMPDHASAQAWADAHAARKFEKAADLLHQAVLESAGDLVSPVPEPYRHLASMYADGRGVSKDAIAACSLAQMARHATMMTAPKRYTGDVRAYDAAIKDSDDFVRTHCEPLTEQDRVAAERSVGCLALGMPEQTATVAGRSVRIGRSGVSFADGNEAGWELHGCPQLVAHVRTTSVAPPDDAAPGVGARHFVEVFSWAFGQKELSPIYALRWDVYEVTDKRIGFFPTANAILELPSWPGRGLPLEVEKGLSVEMIRSGHVRWKVEGSPPKRGWFMLGEGIKR